MGNGCAYSNSLKQKLVARSSTESELIGVHDMLPQILWTRKFLKHQGIKVTDNVMMQDNTSTILLSENGRLSGSKRTKHIDICYFFIKDKIRMGEVRVEYCPTEKMIADFFTKPITGKRFIEIRNIIMNIGPAG